MGRKVKKTFLCGVIIIFCMLSFLHLAYALREMSEDHTGNIEEKIKKESVEKKAVVQRDKKKLKINKKPIKDSSYAQGESPIRDLPDNVGKDRKSSNPYVLGGIFFIIVIGGIVIFVKRIES